jgi:hypothetical protein
MKRHPTRWRASRATRRQKKTPPGRVLDYDCTCPHPPPRQQDAEIPGKIARLNAEKERIRRQLYADVLSPSCSTDPAVRDILLEQFKATNDMLCASVQSLGMPLDQQDWVFEDCWKETRARLQMLAASHSGSEQDCACPCKAPEEEDVVPAFSENDWIRLNAEKRHLRHLMYQHVLSPTCSPDPDLRDDLLTKFKTTNDLLCANVPYLNLSAPAMPKEEERDPVMVNSRSAGDREVAEDMDGTSFVALELDRSLGLATLIEEEEYDDEVDSIEPSNTTIKTQDCTRDLNALL